MFVDPSMTSANKAVLVCFMVEVPGSSSGGPDLELSLDPLLLKNLVMSSSSEIMKCRVRNEGETEAIKLCINFSHFRMKDLK